MVTVNDVKMWTTNKGIGHVVASSLDWWVFTACGSFANFPQTERQPKRVCRQCRARLRYATPFTKPA